MLIFYELGNILNKNIYFKIFNNQFFLFPHRFKIKVVCHLLVTSTEKIQTSLNLFSIKNIYLLSQLFSIIFIGNQDFQD
jgi:hypothetical protein